MWIIIKRDTKNTTPLYLQSQQKKRKTRGEEGISHAKFKYTGHVTTTMCVCVSVLAHQKQRFC